MVTPGCILTYEGKTKDGGKATIFDLDLLTYPPPNQKIKMPRKDYMELVLYY